MAGNGNGNVGVEAFDTGVEQLARWSHPPVGAVKINLHAQFPKRSGTACIAVVARNRAGQVVDGVTLKCPASSLVSAEVLAAEQAVELARRFADSKIVFECQSSFLIRAITGDVITDKWSIYPRIQGIKSTLNTIGEFSWSECKSRANSLAVALVSHLVNTEVFEGDETSWIHPPPNWVARPPKFIEDIVMNEVGIMDE